MYKSNGFRVLIVSAVLLIARGGFAQSGVSPAINPLTVSAPGLSPAAAPFYGGPFTLTVNGLNFEQGSLVSMGGRGLVTSFVSTSQLSAFVPTSALASAGVTPVTVTNIGGQTSNAISLKVLERGDINANRGVNIGDALVTALTVGGVIKPPLANSVGDINLSGSANIGDALTLALFAGRLLPNMPTPAITAVSPVPVIQGSVLTITGTGFALTASDHQVLFTTAGMGVIRIAPNTAFAGNLTVTVPLQAVSGLMQVYRLDVPMGSPEFALVVSGTATPLLLTSVSPFFNVLPGNPVTLTGLGFDPAPSNNTALFRAVAGTVAGTITAATGTSLTVNVPPQAICGGVSVTTGGNTSNQRTITIPGSSCPLLLTDILGGGAPGDTLVLEGAGFDVFMPSGNVVEFAAAGGGRAAAQVLQSGGTQLHVRIPDNAVSGNVTVTLGAQTSNALTYMSPAPVVAGVSPLTGQTGQTVNLTVTGTNFVPAAVITFGGIAIPTTFVSDNTLTGAVTLSSIGFVNVGITNPPAAGGASNTVPFQVTSPQPPTLTSITTNYGTQGQTIQTTLTGTDFVVGATTVTASGTGMTVGAVNVTSATSLTASFAIAATAIAGTRAVTVTTAIGTSNAVTFTVFKVPTLSSVVPASGVQAATVAVTLTGADLIAGATAVAISGTAVTVGTVNVTNSTTLTTTLTIAADAAAGARGLTVTTGGGTSNAVTFTVFKVPMLSSVVPASGTLGATIAVTLTGTDFVTGATTVAIAGTAVTIAIVNVTSATTLSTTLTIASNAALGARGLTVITGGGTSNAVTFTVFKIPTLASVVAASGIQGTTVAMTLTGADFLTGATTVAISGTGVTIGTVNVISSTTLTTMLTIAADAAAGARGLTVITGGGMSNALTFTVFKVPTLSLIVPASGIQGTNVTVALTGADLVAGATTVAISGTAVTIGTVNVESSTRLTTTLTIAAGAAPGTRGVTAITGGGTSNAVTFTVVAIPVLSSIAPAFGLAGNSVQVTLTGSDFVPGATTVLASGTDVTVSTVSVTNAATLTAMFTIAGGATSGFRSVRVTTVGGTSNALHFTVCCAITPIAGLPGTTVPVTLTGTSFSGGVTTVAISGTGVTVGTINVTNSTTLTTTLTIAAGAPSGAHGVTVTTGATTGSLTFWVAPTLVTDNSSRVPPNYYTFLPPASGNSYVDPIFGSTIKRMSNATVSPDVAFGTGFLPFISDEYSTMTPFNADNSRILALHFSYFGLYNGIFDAAGNFIKNLPFAVSASTEPRWSPTKTNILYFIAGNQLKQLDVSTDAISVVHTFAEYTSISGKGESDISPDGDHFVFIGNSQFIFVYTISSDSKGPTFDTNKRAFDSLYITPNNNVTISWYDRGTARYTGIELFDPNMNFVRQVARAGGHMDVTRDQGVEVLVWANSNDPGGTCPNAIVKIRLDNGQQTCILSLDQSLALHISGTDNSGWFFVDTYAPSDPSPSTSSWAPYTNEILQVKLDGTQVRRLAHHRSRPNLADT